MGTEKQTPEWPWSSNTSDGRWHAMCSCGGGRIGRIGRGVVPATDGGSGGGGGSGIAVQSLTALSPTINNMAEDMADDEFAARPSNPPLAAAAVDMTLLPPPHKRRK